MMPYKKYPLLDKKNLKTRSINERKSLVDVKDFAQPYVPGSDFKGFLQSLPKFLAGKDFIEFCQYIKNARKNDKPIIMGLGAHTVKVGLNPIIIDLMERGWVSAIAVNGAFMIHDFEIALTGKTSENVAENLHKGTYGNTEETGVFLNVALKEGLGKKFGAGEAIGHYLISSKFPYNPHSILYKAYKLNIPVTVHPAIGTDFTHYHPHFDGAVVGALAEADFLLFASIVSKIGDGGVYINIGSAVILPEIFLKAIAFCTAQNIKLKNFYTAVFDFNKHYRPYENVVSRPILNGGKGYYFVGHHEIMIPILAAALLSIKDRPKPTS
ncbi:MAG: hypothetical protein JSV88_26035 [Candidatus Aminicenantes bacterium]|nr:MAG: hypothetical protein JSV88_26035 [Candidatus Aminicenantes bacterium]